MEPSVTIRLLPEIEEEVALPEHRPVADEVEGSRRRRHQRRPEDRGARLHRVHHDEEDRDEADERVEAEREMHQRGVEG